MNFDLPPDVERFRERLRAFIEDAYEPTLASRGHPQTNLPDQRAFARLLGSEGLLGLSWPVEYGGQALDPVYQLTLQHELEYMSLPAFSVEIGMVGQVLMRWGSHELKKEFLPRIVAGELVIALGYSEPAAGSDLASLELRATRDGDEFVLNGQKLWTSLVEHADVIWLACRTNVDAPKHAGISILMVDTDTKGIEVQPVYTMGDGRTNLVFFTDARVPASRLVGEVDRGWKYIVEALDYERLGALRFGQLARDVDELIAWSRTPERRDEPAVQRVVPEASIALESVRCHLLRGLGAISDGEVPTVDATMMKVSLSEARQAIADAVVELLGPPGLLSAPSPEAVMGGRFEFNWRSDVVATIVGGANEIQRNILARRHLKLPQG